MFSLQGFPSDKGIYVCMQTAFPSLFSGLLTLSYFYFLFLLQPSPIDPRLSGKADGHSRSSRTVLEKFLILFLIRADSIQDNWNERKNERTQRVRYFALTDCQPSTFAVFRLSLRYWWLISASIRLRKYSSPVISQSSLCLIMHFCKYLAIFLRRSVEKPALDWSACDHHSSQRWLPVRLKQKSARYAWTHSPAVCWFRAFCTSFPG